MTYRAKKIRAAVEQKFGKGWNAGLDPEPYRCADSAIGRHALFDSCSASFFAPRPEFEQDRSKYEN